MSEIKVNKLTPRTNCGTVQLGDSGDTITIPSGVTMTNNGTAAGFGATGAASWDTTVKTASFTGVAGVGYFVNTTSGAITVTLPASPDAGAVIAVKDYANTFDTNAVTLARNGSNIGGAAVDATLSTEGLAVTLVYVDATQGWLVTDNGTQDTAPTTAFVTATGGTITTSGNFKIHTFTGPGTFTVSCAGNSYGSNTVDYLVVAGGGGGGSNVGGGGGAGGFRYSAATYCSPSCAPGHSLRSPTGLPVSAQGYPITVGGGGPGGCGFTLGTPGNNSIFSTITSAGGGGGGSAGPNPTAGPNAQNPTPESGYSEGLPGGSGGGTRGTYLSPGASQPNNHYYNPAGVNVISNGNTPPVSPPQGNRGGAGFDSITSNSQGGGGGGATAVGNDARGPAQGANTGGPGGAGAGLPTAFDSNGVPCGSFRYYAGGGAGASDPPAAPVSASTGGIGGGGSGGRPAVCSVAGTTNTGGGGGGDTPGSAGSNGGSGIVVIRYKFQ